MSTPHDQIEPGTIVRYLGPRTNSYREIGKLYRFCDSPETGRKVISPLNGFWPTGVNANVRLRKDGRVVEYGYVGLGHNDLVEVI